MQGLAAIISAFAVAMWDIAANHGEFTRLSFVAVEHMARSVGLG